MSFLLESKIAHVILAAGSSSRMGEPKQLLVWGETTLIGHAIQQGMMLENVKTYVVLGAYYDQIYPTVKEFPISILKNENWQLGMGSSIRLVIEALERDILTYSAILISLVDQPLLDAKHLNRLIIEFNQNPNMIIATDLNEIIGVPAIITKQYFKELLQLKEDFGARYIIKKHINNVQTISARGKGYDVDTQEEYNTLLKSNFPS
ncbi:nucleotidyltransferase family protein [Aquimarina algiphila]|uniref:nucleotidyltransferase family protein n=1 Tax=Aquimarina algiphila TaxID=2047982 RepID=UPI00232FDDEF|nr:nucleotidyltransferase family protein [Aquimarina algiphila]